MYRNGFSYNIRTNLQLTIVTSRAAFSGRGDGIGTGG